MKYIAIFLLIFGATCQAGIYQNADTQGNVTYSDEPQDESSQLILTTPLSTQEEEPAQNNVSQNTAAAPLAANNSAEAHQEYKAFDIISPKNQENIQNQITILVKLNIDPKLQSGDSIQPFVDGKPWGVPVTSTEMALTGIERGTHEISMALYDKNRTIIKKSNSITIYVHRASVNFNNRPQ